MIDGTIKTIDLLFKDENLALRLKVVFLVMVSFDVHPVFFFQAEVGIRDIGVTGVQTCALPISIARLDLQGWPCRSARATAAGSGARFARSEERRVGKECRSRRERENEKKK